MIRLFLILLIFFLVVRLFAVYGSIGNKVSQAGGKNRKTPDGVPKEIGEYIDYEEVKTPKE